MELKITLHLKALAPDQGGEGAEVNVPFCSAQMQLTTNTVCDDVIFILGCWC